MAEYVTPKLPNKAIPLTRGADYVLGLRRKDESDDPLDWDADIYMLIDIDRTDPTRVDAVVVDDLASIKIESSITDLCRRGTTWRVLRSDDSDDPSTETPLMVGTFERNDGK